MFIPVLALPPVCYTNDSAAFGGVFQLQEEFLQELERLRAEHVQTTQEMHLSLTALTVRRQH